MINGFFTNIGIAFLKLIARLPFGVLYALSDFMFLVVFYLVGYRRKVVLRNLRNSFPEKNEAEINKIAGKFFRHFCDLTLETIKLYAIREKEIHRRMKAENAEIINSFTGNGKSVIVLTMHYNNWEWAVSIAQVLSGTTLAVYKPLHNEVFDSYMNKNRSRFGARLIKNNQILRQVLTSEKDKNPAIIWLAGDQTPPFFHDAWFIFLNQEAMFYPGPAYIAKKFNTPVIFQTIRKTSRGHYCSSFELLIENPETLSETEIIKTYIKKMEKEIEANPEYYLWSHKRWKHNRGANTPLNI